MIELKRVGVGSAAKMGAIAYALFFAIFGFFIFGLEGLLFGAISGISQSGRGANPFAFGSAGIASLCIGYFVGIVFAFIFGGIGGAVGAFVYNVAAGWVGGLEFEMHRMQGFQAPSAPGTPAPLP